jgi:Tfp pilus assembly protein PilO
VIGFKNKDDVLPSTLIVLAILLLAGSLAFMLFAPKQTVKGLADKNRRNQLQVQKQIDDAKEASARAEAEAKLRLWTGRPERVTAEVLAYVTGQTNANKLKLGAFRPQRTVALEGIAELPFSVQISGSFPAVRQFLSALDTPKGRLALRSIQLAGADAASSNVTATLSLSAYVPLDAVPTTDAATKKKGAPRG